MPSKYIKKGESPEGRERRLRAFKHNSFVGHVRMIQMQLLTMYESDTTTQETKHLAQEMHAKSYLLLASLKTRIDP